MLLNHLPRESAFVRARAGDRAAWGDLEHLIASLIDVTQIGNYLTSRAHFKGKATQPKPISRPGQRDDSAGIRTGGGHKYSRAQMRKILDNWGSGVITELESKEVV